MQFYAKKEHYVFSGDGNHLNMHISMSLVSHNKVGDRQSGNQLSEVEVFITSGNLAFIRFKNN